MRSQKRILPKQSNNLPLIKTETICQNDNYIDDRTKKIVSGYINEIQQLLLSIHNNDTYYLIPVEISLLCLQLIDDYFMINSGTFEWIIEGVEYVELLAIPNRAKIQSKIFYIGNVPWRLEIYPNGDRVHTIGDFKIFLRNLDMPSTWNHVYSRNVFKIKQFNVSSTILKQSSRIRNSAVGWDHNTLTLQEIQNSTTTSKITITMNMTILRIIMRQSQRYPNSTGLTNVLYQNKVIDIPQTHKFQWRIDGELLQMMRSDNNPKQYESEIYNNLFKIRCRPYDSTGCRIGLLMCAIPENNQNNNTSALPVRFTLQIKEADICMDMITTMNPGTCYYGDERSFQFTDLDEYSNITIIVEVQVSNSAKQDMITEEWEEYMWKNDAVLMRERESLLGDEYKFEKKKQVNIANKANNKVVAKKQLKGSELFTGYQSWTIVTTLIFSFAVHMAGTIGSDGFNTQFWCFVFYVLISTCIGCGLYCISVFAWIHYRGHRHLAIVQRLLEDQCRVFYTMLYTFIFALYCLYYDQNTEIWISVVNSLILIIAFFCSLGKIIHLFNLDRKVAYK